MSTKLKFGLLLPQFCEHSSASSCLEGARRAEAYGFDSVWVRDHIVFHPHASEGSDNSHVEAFVLLAAVAAVTEKLSLGTAMAICHRQPIHLAQTAAGLSPISNWPQILGGGLASFPQEVAVVGRAG